ncbi:hypothetical protein IHO40_04595 [Wolbachia endosymbiont of Mansonella ozzardi]|nr:hypothetical protein [Wolbachia endosymbiont of Mansonella ozzardi]MCA4775353.1 hypothetical protein [Wolbachia endosymbiont of Mansonella ozzardi]
MGNASMLPSTHVGFGKDSSVLGRNDTMKYGSAIPKPRNKKVLIKVSIDD